MTIKREFIQTFSKNLNYFLKMKSRDMKKKSKMLLMDRHTDRQTEKVIYREGTLLKIQFTL